VTDVTVSDLNIVGGGGALTVRATGDRFRLLRNNITNNYSGMSCVLVGDSNAAAHAGLIQDNVIHNCGHVGSSLDHGIYAQNFAPPSTGGAGLTIQENLFYELAGYAVQLYPNGVGAVVAHNVIDGGGKSVRGGIVLDGATDNNHTIAANIIVYTATGAVIQRTGSGHVAKYNCFWQNPSNVSGSGISSTGNLVADPGFVSRANHDYRLSSTSPCLTVVGYDTIKAIATAQGL
jgi:hypothetical protein